MAFPRERFPLNGSHPKESEKSVYSDIRKYLHFEGVNKLVLGLGDCRTGTTAWLAAASRLGLPAFYQPAKADMRMIQAGMQPEHIYFGESQNALEEESSELAKSGVVVSKETIGPQNLLECTLNPKKTYRYNAKDGQGIDFDKVHVVFFVRNPVAIWQSWKKIFGQDSRIKPMNNERLFSNFVHAAKTELEIFNELAEEEISHTVFAQELLKPPSGIDNYEHSARIIQTIFGQAGVTVSAEQAQFAVSGWRNEGSEGLKKRITFPPEPQYNYEGGIRPTLESEGYQYVPQVANLEDLSQEELHIFQSTGLIDSYNFELLPVSAEQLGIKDYEQFFLE